MFQSKVVIPFLVFVIIIWGGIVCALTALVYDVLLYEQYVWFNNERGACASNGGGVMMKARLQGTAIIITNHAQQIQVVFWRQNPTSTTKMALTHR